MSDGTVVCILYASGFISKVQWPCAEMAAEDMARIRKSFGVIPESMKEVLNVWIE